MLTLNDLFQGFRQPEVIRALAAQITELAKLLPEPLRVLTSSPTLALRVTGGGFPLLGDSCSRSTGFLLHRAA